MSRFILVINNGQLVEQGSREELLRLGGLYKQLHDAQIGSLRSKPKPAVTPQPA